MAPVTYSPYIAGVVLDYSRELGDVGRGPANVRQALRLRQESGLGETEFVGHLHEARRRVRYYQGAQGPGRIANKMAYFFRVLESLVFPASAEPATGACAGDPSPETLPGAAPGPDRAYPTAPAGGIGMVRLSATAGPVSSAAPAPRVRRGGA